MHIFSFTDMGSNPRPLTEYVHTTIQILCFYACPDQIGIINCKLYTEYSGSKWIVASKTCINLNVSVNKPVEFKIIVVFSERID